MRSVVRVHLGPPLFRNLCVFVCSRTNVRYANCKHTIYEKEQFSGNKAESHKEKITTEANGKVIGSLCKTRQSDEDSTIVHRVSFNEVLQREDLKANLNGGVAQLGEHLPCKQGVRSSILLISTTSEQSPLSYGSAKAKPRHVPLFFLFRKKQAFYG